jgi:hypothetical protein
MCSNPDSAVPVIAQGEDGVIGETVFAGESPKFAISELVKTATIGCDPEVSPLILVERFDKLIGEAVPLSEASEYTMIEGRETAAMRADP